MREIRERSLSTTVRACTFPLIFGLITGTAIDQGIEAVRNGDYLLVGCWAAMEVGTAFLTLYNASVEMNLENNRLWWNAYARDSNRRQEAYEQAMAALELQNT